MTSDSRHEPARAVVSLTYDDALPVHRDAVAPELARLGLSGTFYVPAARDDLHLALEAWRAVSRMGHELGNHSCWHPCRTRPDWEWKPPYRLEEYTPERVRDELLLANRILHLVDGHARRSYGATCGDTDCGPSAESFLPHIADLFAVVRAGRTTEPVRGPIGPVVPFLPADGLRAEDVIAVIETMRFDPTSSLVIGFHGVGEGTHQSYVDAGEHRSLVVWIAAQREWLDAVPVIEASGRRTAPPVTTSPLTSP